MIGNYWGIGEHCLYLCTNSFEKLPCKLGNCFKERSLLLMLNLKLQRFVDGCMIVFSGKNDTAVKPVTVIIPVVIILIVLLGVFWFIYAYRNPQSQSGMWLIEVSHNCSFTLIYNELFQVFLAKIMTRFCLKKWKIGKHAHNWNISMIILHCSLIALCKCWPPSLLFSFFPSTKSVPIFYCSKHDSLFVI